MQEDGKVQVREAVVADADALGGIFLQMQQQAEAFEPTLRAPLTRQKIVEVWAGQLAGTGPWVVFVAEVDGEVVGYIEARMQEGAPTANVFRMSRWGVIDGLGVTGEARGRGIGSALMDRAIAWIRAKGGGAAFVESGVRNDGGIRFYQREGFRPTEVRLVREL